MKKNILIILVGLFVLSSCDDLFEPAMENHKTLDVMYSDPSYAQGVLLSSYRFLPNTYDNSEYATDDAVTNIFTNSYLQMATGSWTSAYNPVNKWDAGYAAIQYVNLFLKNCDSVAWDADNEDVSTLFGMRLKGEAYGMRALYMYYLLRSHAGYTESGELLGVPILTESQSVKSDFNQPRPTFQACIDQLLSDLDSADYYLPSEYVNISSLAEIPKRFKGITESVSNYNRTMGDSFRQLFDGQISKAIRSRATLLLASSAYNDSNDINKWEKAAESAADVLGYINGVSGLDPTGNTFFNNQDDLDNLGEGINPSEILWRTSLDASAYDQEEDNFPPTLFGNGAMNPSHNLVKAFPMANGYPIDHESSGFDASNPYVNRDPRLSYCIVFDGNTEGVSNSTIFTGSTSGTDDGVTVLETSTRTGYYMKKRLRMDVNYTNSSGSWQEKNNYTPRIRYSEMFLNYAEAANEAYGPSGMASNASYSAVDVIRAIRERALGITTDAYLDECAADRDKMRELIHNERRLELCFEGFRFWDLRRWKDDLTEKAIGYDVSTGEEFDVESRSYDDYMYYGPIPYSEIKKYDNLVQNKGW
ncbi:MAG: RagB/SusD family nutrient uptake outer membrane protein [Bacteroidales bacterium]|nr:RagB/SusD family nutrient uptake outer membrane protein [Bacteroidales bacterium]